MIKYKDAFVVFEEIPDKISLAINITNCQNRCVGCHSPELRENIGVELTEAEMDRLIAENYGVNCILLMGEGNDVEALKHIAEYVREKYPDMSTAIYSGRVNVEPDVEQYFDYVKTGPYIEKMGPLNSPTTNQRLIFYQMDFNSKIAPIRVGRDITYKFWNRK